MHFADDDRIQLVTMVVLVSAWVSCVEKNWAEVDWEVCVVIGPDVRVVSRQPVFGVAFVVTVGVLLSVWE